MRKLTALFPVLLAVACGGGDKHTDVPTTSSASATPPPSSSAAIDVQPKITAYQFVVGVAGCWLGGVWAEAEGEKREERKMAVEARCADVAKMLNGKTDRATMEQLRGLEPALTDTIPAKVASMAKDEHFDPAKSEALVKLVTALGTTEREALLARRACDKVKGDIDKLATDKDKDAARERDADKLTNDEVATVGQIKPVAALEALMKLDAGEYTHAAKALGLLIAMSRVERASGLPRHMKVYATGGIYRIVFGVTPPAVPEDANAKLVPGTWLTFITAAATAAGHAVPATAKTPKEKFMWAEAGVWSGFADKLKVEQPQTTGELSNVLIIEGGHIDALVQLYNARASASATPTPPKGPPAKK